MLRPITYGIFIPTESKSDGRDKIMRIKELIKEMEKIGLSPKGNIVFRRLRDAIVITKPRPSKSVIDATLGKWANRKDIKSGTAYESKIRKEWEKRLKG